MSQLSDRMTLIKSTIAAQLPLRVVTRNLKDFGQRKPADLKAGIYTLISNGEGGYENLNSRAAMDGRHRMSLIGQIQLGEKAEPSEIEDAEFVMVEEIKAFCRNLPPQLACLSMTGYQQSAQVDAPYGWIAVDLEMSV